LSPAGGTTGGHAGQTRTSGLLESAKGYLVRLPDQYDGKGEGIDQEVPPQFALRTVTPYRPMLRGPYSSNTVDCSLGGR
jgi:hypothetical protein